MLATDFHLRTITRAVHVSGSTRHLIRAAAGNAALRSISRGITTTTEKKTEAPHIELERLPPAHNTSLVRLTTESEREDGKFLTKPVFQHPGYDLEDMKAIKFEHRPVQSPRDAITYNFMKYLRKSFDFCTGYIEPRDEKHQIEIGKGPNRMTREKWLARVIVLESIAGIPGAVAGFLRHMHAMRLFRRDMAFIDTLYDEAFNERMHLLTFLKMARPTIFTRFLLWIGQVAFGNCFFTAYVFSPKTCHRFVGYLEEEAVNTYSRLVRDLELGLCDDFKNSPVPQIAKDYWKLPENATMYDVILYIRADEAKHREVNHTFANLKQKGEERNPFALQIEGVDKPQPSKTLKNHHAKGWEREELIL